MIHQLLKAFAFLKRDFLSEISYRLAFFMQVAGILLSLLAFYYLTKMIDPNAAGLDGIRPFDWLMIGMAFQFYFSTALYAFSAKIRNEQLLGTLEAMLVSPMRLTRRQRRHSKAAKAWPRTRSYSRPRTGPGSWTVSPPPRKRSVRRPRGTPTES